MSCHKPGFIVVAVCVYTIARCSFAEETTAEGRGLEVSQQGQLSMDGKPLRAFGVNYYSAFSRRLIDASDTSYHDGFAELSKHGIAFARFMAGAQMPIDMKRYVDAREEYFELMDGVVRAAEEHGIGLIPSLFWNNSCIPDLVGEPRNQWGNPGSKTIAFLRQYTADVVARYRDSPAIWAWEFGNEYDLAADLPNAAEHRPPIRTDRGTPATRTDADDLTQDMIVAALQEFGRVVRSLDPRRPITTGNSLPRPSSYHQYTQRTWTADTREQFIAQLLALNPDPCNLISVHVYPHDHEKRFRQSRTSYDEILALCMEAGRRAGKPVFVGEWGAPDERDGPARDLAKRDNHAFITALDRNCVPLSALWVYDFPAQERQHNVTAENDRKYLLNALGLANDRADVVGHGAHAVRVEGGNFAGTLMDFVANKGRSGNGFNPLQHKQFRGENLFRDDATGLYFEHVFNGTAADAAIQMFTPNHDEHRVERVSDSTAVMRHPAATSAWGIESEMKCTLNGDAVDMEFAMTPTRDRFPLGYVAFMWASYMNHARDRLIRFYGYDGEKEGWIAFGEPTPEQPEGFETGTVSYWGAADLPYEDGANTLNVIEDSEKKFLLPFYYGLVDGDGDFGTQDDTMAYIMMFDQCESIRFALWNFIRNTAGERDRHSPAWDWQFVVRNPAPGRTYSYRARLLYLPFLSDEQIRTQYEDWVSHLPALQR